LVVTAEVITVNVTEEDPASIWEVLLGMTAALLLLESTMVAPAAAGAASITVQTLGVPPTTVAGTHRSEGRLVMGAVTERGAVTWPPL
jgi:hypothetical protein